MHSSLRPAVLDSLVTHILGRMIRHLLAASLLFSTVHADPTSPPSHSVKELIDATDSFLNSLEEETQGQASFQLTHKQREAWFYTPRKRQGVPLKQLNDHQKNAAIGMLTTLLSDKGAFRAGQIILMESVLATIEQNPDYRDMEKYYVSIFGEPGDNRGWGFRFEGHHLSLNCTVVENQKFAVTPCFMGANPAVAPEGEHQGMRPLAAEEDLARALLISLLSTKKNEVIFSDKAPHEILTGEQRNVTPLERVGVKQTDMTTAQQEALFELIAEFTHRFRPEIADPELAAIRQAGELSFGWAGGTHAGEPFYYRIQGPSFVIETANVQNKGNHIHTVWRDFDGDFGRDLLREHVEQHH